MYTQEGKQEEGSTMFEQHKRARDSLLKDAACERRAAGLTLPKRVRTFFPQVQRLYERQPTGQSSYTNPTKENL